MFRVIADWPTALCLLSTNWAVHLPKYLRTSCNSCFVHKSLFCRPIRSCYIDPSLSRIRRNSSRASDTLTPPIASGPPCQTHRPVIMSFEYPAVRRDEQQSEVLHGVTVKDPYRWLENLDSPETHQFVKEQCKLFKNYISDASDMELINKRFNEWWNFPRYGAPYKKGDNYFYYKNTGLQNHSVFYKLKTLDSEPEVFLDPNQLSKDGTVSLGSTAFSEDGSLFAYSLSESGSDWHSIRVRNVETGQDYPEEVKYAKFTLLSFTLDNKGYFYSRFPDRKDMETKIDEYHMLYYHRINTPQSQDVRVIHFPDNPDYMVSARLTDCGRYLLVFVSKTCADITWHYVDLNDYPEINGEFAIKPLVTDFDAEYHYITNDDNLMYFYTNKNSSNFSIKRLDINKPQIENWVTILPEHPKDVLVEAKCVHGDKLVVLYLRDVINVLEVRKLQTGELIQQLDIPIGSVSALHGRRKHSEIFFSFNFFVSPGTVYYFDFNKHKTPQIYRETQIPKLNPDKFIAKQVFYTSKDGTKVPMFVFHRKDLEFNQKNPTVLYGYGGFKCLIKPFFSVNRMILVDGFKGVFALANIRGGGEYGKSWHDSGRLLNKQNGLDDFHSAAEYLIENKYTSAPFLTIEGASNGGLLVAACGNQRPDLYGAVIAHVGVLDLVRFHKFTIGRAWISDYGDPDDEEYFKNILKISPLHNIPKDVDHYPATLLLTADHDNRVVPSHSFKFIAELQHSLGKKLPKTPFMIRVDTKAGHGSGKPVSKSIKELIDIYAFLTKAVGYRYQN